MNLPSLLELIRDSIKVTRVGDKYHGNCPFHDDDTPSFYYYPQTDSFYCFGCKRFGKVLQFLSYRDGVSIETLKERYLTVESKYGNVVEKILYEELSTNQNLLSLAEGLGFTSQMVDSYRLGFLNDVSRQRLLKEVGRDGLKSLGMMIGTRLYLPDGVVIPLRSRGKMVGAQVRKMAGTPKYMTSLETSSFKKSEYLFGLDECGKSFRLILVESPKDAMYINSKGGNSMASLGSNLSVHQVDKLSALLRYKFLYLYFDPDIAGQTAMVKLIQALPRYLWSKVFVSSSLELDPYEYCRLHGHQGMVRDAVPAVEFLRCKDHLSTHKKVLYMEDINKKEIFQISHQGNAWALEATKLLTKSEYLLPRSIAQWLDYLNIRGVVSGHDILSPEDLERLKRLVLGAFLRQCSNKLTEPTVRWAIRERELGMIDC